MITARINTDVMDKIGGYGMIFGNDRYFPPWEYNTVRMINRLADMVEDAGGRVDRSGDELYVHTTGYDASILQVRNKLKKCSAYRRELEELEMLREEAPVVRTCFINLVFDIGIRFTLDGYDYRFDSDGNPFCPDSWMKVTKGAQGVYNSVEAIDKAYFIDDMMKPVASEETVEEATSRLFEYLVSREPLRKYA